MKNIELIPNQEYYLEYTGDHCCTIDTNGLLDFKKGLYKYIGTVGGKEYSRNIFINFANPITYVMFDAKRTNYIKDPEQVELLNKIESLEKELKILKKQVQSK
jgi:hypothetical protein